MSVTGVCRITACILHNHKLIDVSFNRQPSACVAHDAWRHEGLFSLPDDVVCRGWPAVLEVLRHRVRNSGAQQLKLFATGIYDQSLAVSRGSFPHTSRSFAPFVFC